MHICEVSWYPNWDFCKPHQHSGGEWNFIFAAQRNEKLLLRNSIPGYFPDLTADNLELLPTKKKHSSDISNMSKTICTARHQKGDIWDTVVLESKYDLNIYLRDDSALLGKVCNSFEHPVSFQQGQQVVWARLLPQRGSQAFPGLVVLHSCRAPQEGSAVENSSWVFATDKRTCCMYNVKMRM